MVVDNLDDPNTIYKTPRREKDRFDEAVQHNQYEYLIWQLVKGTPDERFFVPILDHHPKFHWLLMPKGRPIKPSQIPTNTPSYFWDHKKRQNWVQINGEIKLCDYGSKYMHDCLIKIQKENR
jgi:hypothetical protein